MPDDQLLEGLNPAQREAVTCVEGPLLILAGPGSGKTRVVTTRIAYLLARGISPKGMAALTFTNKAAEEMRARLRQFPKGDQVWISTFHRFCSMLLRKYAPFVGLAENFTILDAEDSLSIVKSVLDDATLPASKCTPQQIARLISNAKNDLVPPEALARRARTNQERVAAEAYPRYQRHLATANAVDFDDLLCHVAHLLHDQTELRALLDEHFRYVMVDEYQDTNRAQYAVVRGLSVDHPNLAVTGDPDQSIYSWRGANIGNILSFERDYPGARV
ncbi:MAG TPA: UvrD-helicase domain-containing protein, partial [Pirellulaceae bacterium]